MRDVYDILTIYDFYDEIGIKINDLLNYCIKNIEDKFLIEELSCINKKYRDNVMRLVEEERKSMFYCFSQDELGDIEDMLDYD